MISVFRILFILFWSVLMISLSLIVMLLTFDRRILVIMARTIWSSPILWAAGVQSITVKGLENIDKKKSYIFVSNHQSILDIPTIIRSVPLNLYFVAKEELKWVPFLGWYVWATGMIFIDRKNKLKAVESLKHAGKLIKKGKNVLAFPEGTRSPDGNLQKFKKGFFMLAIRHDIEVVPIAIEGTHRVLPTKTWKFTAHDVRVSVGKPACPPKNKKEAGRFIADVSRSIDEMMGG